MAQVCLSRESGDVASEVRLGETLRIVGESRPASGFRDLTHDIDGACWIRRLQTPSGHPSAIVPVPDTDSVWNRPSCGTGGPGPRAESHFLAM